MWNSDGMGLPREANCKGLNFAGAVACISEVSWSGVTVFILQLAQPVNNTKMGKNPKSLRIGTSWLWETIFVQTRTSKVVRLSMADFHSRVTGLPTLVWATTGPRLQRKD